MPVPPQVPPPPQGQADPNAVQPWQKLVQQAIDGLVEASKGFIGFGLGDPQSKANQLGQLVQAGIPFAAPLGKVFHGTAAPFEHINPLKGDIQDTLGSYVHFAEDPQYAEQYLFGKTGYTQWPKMQADPNYVPTRLPGQQPRIIPAKLNTQDALDLHIDYRAENADYSNSDAVRRMDPGDFQRLYEAANPEERQYIDAISKRVDLAVPEKGSVRNWLGKFPEVAPKAGFKAIRYNDGINPAWAVTDPSIIQTPWGLPLTDKSWEPGMYQSNPERSVHMGHVKMPPEVSILQSGNYNDLMPWGGTGVPPPPTTKPTLPGGQEDQKWQAVIEGLQQHAKTLGIDDPFAVGLGMEKVGVHAPQLPAGMEHLGTAFPDKPGQQWTISEGLKGLMEHGVPPDHAHYLMNDYIKSNAGASTISDLNLNGMVTKQGKQYNPFWWASAFGK